MPLTGNPLSTNMSEIADAGDQPPIHFLTVKAYGNMRNITQHFADQHRARFSANESQCAAPQKLYKSRWWPRLFLQRNQKIVYNFRFVRVSLAGALLYCPR